jgi:hypothetical protein
MNFIVLEIKILICLIKSNPRKGKAQVVGFQVKDGRVNADIY